MQELSLFEIIFFVFLFSLERVRPARQFPVYRQWLKHWLGLITFASVWLAGLVAIWPLISVPWQPLQNLSFPGQIFLTYLVFSFVAYWYHRARHTIPQLWHYVHYMHHSPAHMDTRVTFWRHPIEMILDSLVILLVGKSLGVSVEVIFCVLLVESMLEIFHHSNIHTPKKLRWIGYFLQIPEQHLIHHQYGLHRWNYATVTLWDTLFGTLRIPDEWNYRVGVKEWNNTKKLLLFKY